MRIVGVEHELGVRQRGRRVAPAGGEQLQLAVAVELVAEQVRQQQRPGLYAARHLGQRRLVDLEQPQFGLAGGQQRRGDPRDEVRARAVVCDPEARPQDLGGHRRRRGLAVRRRDEHRACREPGCERVDQARIELPGQLSRQCRAPAAACEPRERADARERGNLEGAGEGRPHARTVPICDIGPEKSAALANLPIRSTILGDGRKAFEAALPCRCADRPGRARRLPGGAPQALLRRADPAGAAGLCRPSRPLTDDEGVRSRPRGRCPSADGDRALRVLERRQARSRADAAPVRDPRGAAGAAAEARSRARADADGARSGRAARNVPVEVALLAHLRLAGAGAA